MVGSPNPSKKNMSYSQIGYIIPHKHQPNQRFFRENEVNMDKSAMLQREQWSNDAVFYCTFLAENWAILLTLQANCKCWALHGKSVSDTHIPTISFRSTTSSNCGKNDVNKGSCDVLNKWYFCMHNLNHERPSSLIDIHNGSSLLSHRHQKQNGPMVYIVL